MSATTAAVVPLERKDSFSQVRPRRLLIFCFRFGLRYTYVLRLISVISFFITYCTALPLLFLSEKHA